MIISKTNIQKIEAKLSTYIGFSIRSGQVLYGVDNISTCKKRIFLILVSGGLGDSSKDKITKVATDRACPIYYLEDGLLADFTHKEGVKAIAILDTSLAGAISDCISSL